jgi:tRNA nucleotidyltransferase (CCA-adding enzyme)
MLVLAAARLAEDEPDITNKLDWYITGLRDHEPRLDGHALRQLGLPPGPRYRPILAALRDAVLDGQLPDEAAEWDFLRRGMGDGCEGWRGNDATPEL